MTKTALANKEIKSREDIARAERNLKREEGIKERNAKKEIQAMANKAQLWSSGINAIGRLGSSGLGGLGKALAKNDPAWYKSYIKDLQNFVNVPTYDRLGSGRFGDLMYYIQDDGVSHDFAGIMTFEWIPVVGPQETGASHFRNAVNQTLTRLKEKVLALNSRSNVSWEPSDLGYNLFCSADIMSAILDLGRVIKVYQTYRSRNAYLAQSLITALGWTFSDIEAHYADYRKTYTILARKFNSAIIAPASVHLYSRRAFLATNVFIDVSDAKCVRQMYAYKQRSAFILSSSGDYCNLTTINRSNLTAFTADMQLRFSRITDNPDFVEMYQDLRHAFGSDIIQIETDVSDKEIEFNTNELNRAQIHNVKTAPSFDGTEGTYPADGWDLRQDSSGYLYQGSSSGVGDRKLSKTASYPGTVEQFLNAHVGSNARLTHNMYSEVVNGDEIIDITRCDNVFDVTLSNTNLLTLVLRFCGTEFVAIGKIWYMEGDSLSSDIFSTYACERTPVHFAMELGHWSNFDWAPIVHAVLIDDTDAFYTCTYLEAYTTFIIDRKSTYDIHAACVMGELYCDDSNFKGFVS